MEYSYLVVKYLQPHGLVNSVLVLLNWQEAQETDRQDKTTLFNQGSPVSCKAGILRGPGFNKTYIYTFTIKLQG